MPCTPEAIKEDQERTRKRTRFWATSTHEDGHVRTNSTSTGAVVGMAKTPTYPTTSGTGGREDGDCRTTHTCTSGRNDGDCRTTNSCQLGPGADPEILATLGYAADGGAGVAGAFESQAKRDLWLTMWEGAASDGDARELAARAARVIDMGEAANRIKKAAGAAGVVLTVASAVDKEGHKSFGWLRAAARSVAEGVAGVGAGFVVGLACEGVTATLGTLACVGGGVAAGVVASDAAGSVVSGLFDWLLGPD